MDMFITYLIRGLLYLYIVSMQAEAKQESVKLENNIYSGLVIAIHPDVKENAALLDLIKEMMTNASSILFEATRKRAHYGNIDILVPASWATGNYESTTTINYEQSDIRIAPSHPGKKDEPYVVQPRGCGEFGDFMYVTPGFLTKPELENDFGEKGKVIVHEWAHLRWGVFDEYPLAHNPPFYLQNGKLEATRCPLGLRGRNLIPDYKNNRYYRCQLDKKTGLPTSPNCRFFPQSLTGSASLMSHVFLKQVTHFCHNDPTDPDNLHNRLAPNDQNRLCNLRSTWSVISESEDFTNNANPPNEALADHTPTFRVLIPQSYRKFALVLDTSGSMGGDRIVEMRQAVRTFLMQALPLGEKVAVVEFSYLAFTLSEGLMDVDTDEDRQRVLDTVDVFATGSTCIGCGIQEAMLTLTGPDGTDTCGDIIVFTDGQENTRPYVREVSQAAIDKDCKVHAIFFTTTGNEPLKALSIATKGSWFFAHDKSQNFLVGSFTKIARRTDGRKLGGSSELASETYRMEANQEQVGGVDVDGTVGRDTNFEFTWLSDTSPTVEVTAPDGCKLSTALVVANSCPEHPLAVTNEQFKTINFEIPGIAQRGRWLYSIQASVADTITVTATSKSVNDKVQPIVVDSTFQQPKKGDPIVARARVTRGGRAVLDLQVTAEIQTPTGDIDKITLLDKGTGVDTNANDGIYSKAYTKSKAAGRYSMQVTVRGEVTQQKQVETDVSRAPFNHGIINEEGVPVLNPSGEENKPVPVAPVNTSDIGNFTRVDTAAGVEVEPPDDPVGDTFAPSRITNLVASQVDTSDRTKGVVITFTAPGDDADTGNATRYEICYTLGDGIDLILNFGNQSCVETPISGNLLQPNEGGNAEEFVVETPEFTTNEGVVTIAFGVRAFDESGNVGPPSNVEFVNFFLEPPVVPDVSVEPIPAATRAPPTTTSPPTTTPPPDQGFVCMTCNNARSVEECSRIGKLKLCDGNQGSCETEVRTQNFGKQTFISKFCKQTLACRNNAAQNIHQCHPQDSMSVCRCCCETSRCNVGTSCTGTE